MAKASESDLDFEVQFIQDKLDEVVITPAEKEDYVKYVATVWERPTMWSDGSDDGSSSPGSDGSGSTSTVTQYHSGQKLRMRRLNKSFMPETKAAFRKFILDNQNCDWNGTKAEDVYYYFNATMRIIQPDEFLAVSCVHSRPHLTIDYILKTLSAVRDPPCRKWEHLPKELKTFLSMFTGIEELANCFNDREKATDIIRQFRIKIELAMTRCLYPQFCDLYDRLLGFVDDVVAEGVPSEETSEKYVRQLLDVFSYAARIPNFWSKRGFTLYVGQDQAQQRGITPDFTFQARNEPFMVGEVKRFGAHGSKFEENRAKIPPKSTNEQECSQVNEPVLSDSSECSGQDDHYPGRSLGSREWYKVRCYLPQLMGQMLTLMQNRKSPPKICSDIENVELGFAVEGFKLRFVKLVLRDYKKKKERPTVEKFLHSSILYKSDVFLTQEFNLFKGKHLVMLFKMLLAIYYQSRN